MRSSHRLIRLLQLAACLMILKVTWGIVAGYGSYFPPDFTAVFLRGRKAYFYGSYQWAFYPHIVAGPVVLVQGLLLTSSRLRTRFPQWHMWMGRLQVAFILMLLAPSGLWMAFYAHTVWFARAGFALLAVATGIAAAMGWRLAVARRFADHRRWMIRCYILLCSAVVTRLLGGLFVMLQQDGEWTYWLAAWISWVVPLALYEGACRIRWLKS